MSSSSSSSDTNRELQQKELLRKFRLEEERKQTEERLQRARLLSQPRLLESELKQLKEKQQRELAEAQRQMETAIKFAMYQGWNNVKKEEKQVEDITNGVDEIQLQNAKVNENRKDVLHENIRDNSFEEFEKVLGQLKPDDFQKMFTRANGRLEMRHQDIEDTFRKLSGKTRKREEEEDVEDDEDDEDEYNVRRNKRRRLFSTAYSRSKESVLLKPMQKLKKKFCPKHSEAYFIERYLVPYLRHRLHTFSKPGKPSRKRK